LFFQILGCYYKISSFNLISEPIYWLQGDPPWQGQSFGPWIGGFQPPDSEEPIGGWEWRNNDGNFFALPLSMISTWMGFLT
jgi:hypothetical protein